MNGLTVNGLVHRGGREGGVVVPVDVKDRVRVGRPLLLDFSAVEFPEADGVVERARQEHRADAVPLEREDRPLVHREDEVEISGGPEESPRLGACRIQVEAGRLTSRSLQSRPRTQSRATIPTAVRQVTSATVVPRQPRNHSHPTPQQLHPSSSEHSSACTRRCP